MKSIVSILLLAFCLFSLTACSKNKNDNTVTTDTATIETGIRATSSGLKDGTYSAKMSEEYAASHNHGWQPQLTISVKNGEVESATYDETSNGKRKSSLSDVEYVMNPPVSEWLQKLNENIKKAATPEEIDIISGATSSSSEARKLYSAVLSAAQHGNTSTIIVDQ